MFVRRLPSTAPTIGFRRKAGQKATIGVLRALTSETTAPGWQATTSGKKKCYWSTKHGMKMEVKSSSLLPFAGFCARKNLAEQIRKYSSTECILEGSTRDKDGGRFVSRKEEILESRSELLQRAQLDAKNIDEASQPADSRSRQSSSGRQQRVHIGQKRPVCLIIGAGPGIGMAVAKRFAFGGYAVAAVRRNAEKLDEVIDSVRSDNQVIIPFPCDARKEDNVIQLFQDVEASLGRVNVCVFNIGSNISFPLLETSAIKFHKCWEMGCNAGFLVGREAARSMLRGENHSSEGKRGTIIFTGASASVRGAANFAAFGVAKAGLRSLAQSMARELGPKGLHVSHVIIDGAVDTPWIRENFADAIQKLPPDGLCRPDDIAEVYWQIAKQRQSAWTHEMDLRPYSESF